MKTYLLLPLACLIGYMVGTWGAQEELRAFKAHSRDVKDRAAGRPTGFDTFARMVKIPETARRSRRPRAGRRKEPVSTISPAASTNAAISEALAAPVREGAASAVGAVTNAPRVSLSPEDLRARIEEAQDLWRTRVDVARAQWKARLKLDAEGEKAFDAALQEMNERLYDSVSTLAGMLSEKQEMTPELGLRLVGETTAILAETYDRIGACAQEGMRDEISTMQIGDFIDPGVAEPLIGVQGKLEGFMINTRKGR